MFFKKHLNAFNVYLLILIFFTSICINVNPNFPDLNNVIYLFIHLLIIYIIIYHFRNILYLIFFFLGLIFDNFILNEIGPHLITFMILTFALNLCQKIYNYFTSRNILVFIFFVLILSLIIENFLSLFLYSYSHEIQWFFKSILIILIIGYPIFYIFNKIDKLG